MTVQDGSCGSSAGEQACNRVSGRPEDEPKNKIKFRASPRKTVI